MWRRRDKQHPTVKREDTHPAEQQARVTPVVTLRPMTDEEFQHLRTYMDEGYAHEVAQLMDMTMEEA